MHIKNVYRDFIRGWILGNFQPSLYQTKDFEMAIKEYKKGDTENRHFHAIAMEYTIIASGKVKMNNIIYEKGDIITIKPLQDTDFIVLEDTITVVVKIPCVKDDKFPGKWDNDKNKIKKLN